MCSAIRRRTPRSGSRRPSPARARAAAAHVVLGDPALRAGACTEARSTPSSRAILRTSGVARTLASSTASAGACCGAARPSAGARRPRRSRRARCRRGRPGPPRPGSARPCPAAGEGISTVVLSVWISTSGSSSATSWPTETSQRAISPSVRPSPRSGSLNSYATAARTLAGRARSRRRRARSARAARPRPPERDGLLVAGELGRDLARDVAGLDRALLVPDPDRVRVVLVLGLRERARAGGPGRSDASVAAPPAERRRPRRGRRGSARPPSARARRSPRRAGRSPTAPARARA